MTTTILTGMNVGKTAASATLAHTSTEIAWNTANNFVFLIRGDNVRYWPQMQCYVVIIC